MKKLYFLFLLLLNILFIKVNAQKVYLPDSAFRQKLTNLGYSSCLSIDSIDSTCTMVKNATYLSISSSNIINLQGIQAFSNLQYLYCAYNALSTVPDLPNSLKYLDCSYNAISTIPFTLPDSLETIDCSFNQLSTFPQLPAKVQVAKFNNNSINLGLPAAPIPWPTTLVTLDCAFNSIDTVFSLPPNIMTFNVEYNNIRALPSLPSSLNGLYCGYNSIRVLPQLPPFLEYLSVFSDSIHILPVLPSTLKNLLVQLNQLDSLPTLPPNLTYLNCQNNLLKDLPNLPNSLNEVNASTNLLSSLPSDLTHLKKLDLSHNPHLKYIPELGDTLINLYLDYLDSLTCLPRYNVVSDLRFTNCPMITCLPTYGNVLSSSPPISSLPLCGVFNPNGCNFFWNIGGKSYYDLNNDCQVSFSEPGMPITHINLYQNGSLVQQIFTGLEGYYSFDINGNGIYTVEIDTVAKPYIVTCPVIASFTDTVTATDSLFDNNNFALACNNFDLGVWTILSTEIVRPNHLSIVKALAGDLSSLYGMHCANGISGSVTITINGSATYFAPATGALTPSTISGNVITYNIADFGLVNAANDFAFDFLVDSTAINNSQICFDVNVTLQTGDINPVNNSMNSCVTVHTSFDPNMKEVYPEGNIDTSGNWLIYTIRFQNTGSISAENIYILDTIDSDLDLSTFSYLAASHSCFVQVLDGGIARFNFPHINLPDSTSNEPMSHGYIQYKIKTRSGLPSGTQITNTAHIYFDFNLPVATNTTVNTINFPSYNFELLKNKELKIWPVPFEDALQIETSEYNLGSHYSIVDIFGRELINGSINKTHLKINTSNFVSGVYFFRMETNSGQAIRKIIKK